MTQLVPCPTCRRHVSTREMTCPFCAHALPPARAQHIVLLGRVSRAAVFSAALAACSDDKPKPPAPAPTQGSDDLEQLLDQQPQAVEHAPPIDAPIDAPSDAALVDAGVPPDAGIVKKKKRVRQETITVPPPDRIQNAKPYGAPPARRRIV